MMGLTAEPEETRERGEKEDDNGEEWLEGH